MRQEHETAKSFNQLKAITQAFMLKNNALTNATHQESDRTQQAHEQTSENANISDLTQKTGSKPKTSAQTKKGRLNPTKRAFSERQKTTLKNGQKSANERQKTEQANNSSLREKPSEQAFKQGLANNPSNQKGGTR